MRKTAIPGREWLQHLLYNYTTGTGAGTGTGAQDGREKTLLTPSTSKPISEAPQLVVVAVWAGAASPSSSQ
ncbi:hypothetical protein CIB48_g7284 [Xylaria polymorpha]|nr:hypothetical protein CIB48_g7284 [Xylaria polymorpha]